MSGRTSSARRSLADLVEPGEPLAQAVLGPDDTGALGHHVSERPLQRPRELVTATGEELVDLLARSDDRGAVAHMDIEGLRPARGLAAHDPAEDEALGQRVSAEPVGAVDAGCALADRVETLHVGGMGRGVDADAAHRVVRGRGDLHRGRRDVEHGQVDELPVHARQTGEDHVAVETRDVEEHAAMLGSAPLRDLGVVGQGDAVARESSRRSGS